MQYRVFGRANEKVSNLGYGCMRLPSKQRASVCRDCGRCEQHCPQGIAIREELKNVSAALED